MSKQILGTMRNLNNIIRGSKTNGEILSGIVNVLQNSTKANTLLTNNNGKVISSGIQSNLSNSSLFIKRDDAVYLDNKISGEVCNINETKSNFNLGGMKNCNAIVLPLDTGRENGSMLLYKEDGKFSDEDLLTAEICANSAALIMRQTELEEDTENKRKDDIVKSVLDTLSFTELDVLVDVFDHINDKEGFVVASKIADKNGYARSVTVNALRKLESAGVIFTRSLGVKGTYIKILNNKLPDAVRKMNAL